MKKGGRGAASGGKMSPKYSKAHYAKPSEDSGAKKKRRLIDEEIESASDDEVADSGEERELGAPDTDETRLSVAQSYLHRIAAASRKSQNYCNVSADALPFDQVLDPQDDSVSVDYERNENSDDELFLDVEAKGTASQYLKDRLNPNADLQNRKDSALSLEIAEPIFYKGHKSAVTCVALPGSSVECGGSVRSRHAYSGAKDCCIIKWDLETGKKQVFRGGRNSFGSPVCINNQNGHFRHVLGLCVTADESMVFSCGADHTIKAWDPRASNTVPCFELRGHKAPVTAVRLNTSSNPCSGGDVELLSCGADKSIKVWSITCRAVSRHFFGHSSGVNTVDMLQPNKPVSGGDDGTLRSWKLTQDTHTVYPSLGSPIDSVACLSPSLFACGSQLGLLSIFSSRSRRPLACCRVSLHEQAKAASSMTGFAAEAASRALAKTRATNAASVVGRTESEGITSIKAIPSTSTFFVGSESGMVQLWRTGGEAHGRALLAPVNSSFRFLDGVVNGIEYSLPDSATLTKPELLVCGVATEHRLGRWTVAKGVKNGIALMKINA